MLNFTPTCIGICSIIKETNKAIMSQLLFRIHHQNCLYTKIENLTISRMFASREALSNQYRFCESRLPI
ncbi:hypothetical protein Hanom_Chr06g00536101 [Helianthus anomalus]